MTVPTPSYLWNLDGTGANAVESIDGAYFLDIDGATQNADGIVEKAYSFDGSNDDLMLPLAREAGGELHKQDSFSISFWFWHDSSQSSTGAYPCAIRSGSTTARWNFAFNNSGSGIMYCLVQDDLDNQTVLTCTGTGTITDDAWHFCNMSYNHSTKEVRFHIDRADVQTTTMASAINQDATARFAVGTRHDEFPTRWKGRIDQIAYWDGTVVTDAQFDELYNSGSGLDITPAGAPLGSASLLGAGR